MGHRAIWVATVVSVSSVWACANQPRSGSTTWSDDEQEGITSRGDRYDGDELASDRGDRFSFASPFSRSRAVTIGAEPEAAQRKSHAVNADELELALMRFTTKRRSLMNHDAPAMHSTGQREDGSATWPRPLEVAFENVLEQLERGFAAPKGSVPRRLLIQARVTLEVEVEAAESKFGRAPVRVVDRVGKLFAAIAVHMRASAPIEDRRVSSHAISLSWPVQPVIVTSPFGYRRDPILGRESVRFHAGVDLGGELGDLVHSAGPGRVVSTGWLGGHGRAVVVQHAGGYQTMYAHLRTILTTIGAVVETGSPIGSVGSSGRSTGPHLHFEVRHGGAPVDPLEVVDTRIALEVEAQETSAFATAAR